MTDGERVTDGEHAKILGQSVLLYDGVCALCNGLVRFVLKRDAAGTFRFAALDSAVSRELAGSRKWVEGVVLVVDALGVGQRVYQRSDAVVEVLRSLGGGWRVMGRLLGAIPHWLREWGYGVVARIRYSVFGRYAVCPVPDASIRSRFVV
jgi:predicted DCC family thiol-disulfide oxidoreductase YuxK